MQKHHKILLWVAILIPAGVGGYLLYKFFKKPTIDHSNPVPGSKPQAPVQSSTPSIFPIKNGSPKNELVKQLQGLLGVTPDGIDGPKTTAALLLKTGKTQIASQAEFDQVIAKLQAAGQSSAGAARADKLVSDWLSNTALQMTVISATAATQVIQDAYTNLIPTGEFLGLPANTTYSRDQHVLVSSTGSGNLAFQRLGPNKQGLYTVDPNKVTLT